MLHLCVPSTGSARAILRAQALTLPLAQDTALNHAEQLFAQGDTNGDGVLNCEEVIALMLKVSLLLCDNTTCAFVSSLSKLLPLLLHQHHY